MASFNNYNSIRRPRKSFLTSIVAKCSVQAEGNIMQAHKTGMYSTKNRLMNAMVTLGNQKGFEETSVIEICEMAEINRSTFYRNYESKDHLLRELEATYLQAIDLLCQGYHSFNFMDEETVLENCSSIARKIYAFHMESKEMFRFLMSPNCDPYFRDRLKRLLHSHFAKLICSNMSSPPVTVDYAIGFVSGGIIDCLYQWIQRQDISEEEFADIVTRLIVSSVQCCLNT